MLPVRVPRHCTDIFFFCCCCYANYNRCERAATELCDCERAGKGGACRSAAATTTTAEIRRHRRPDGPASSGTSVTVLVVAQAALRHLFLLRHRHLPVFQLFFLPV